MLDYYNKTAHVTEGIGDWCAFSWQGTDVAVYGGMDYEYVPERPHNAFHNLGSLTLMSAEN